MHDSGRAIRVNHLPDIAAHVIQPEFVRLERTDRSGAGITVGTARRAGRCVCIVVTRGSTRILSPIKSRIRLRPHPPSPSLRLLEQPPPATHASQFAKVTSVSESANGRVTVNSVGFGSLPSRPLSLTGDPIGQDPAGIVTTSGQLRQSRAACERPVSVLSADPDPLNPREEFDQLCTLVCWHRRYTLGDSHEWHDPQEFLRAIEDRPHLKLPLYFYDHSGITIATQPFSCPWDSGQVGWVFIERCDFQLLGDPNNSETSAQDRAMAAMRAEFAEYDQFISGDIWWV